MKLTTADKYALAGLIPALLILVGVVLALQFIVPANITSYVLVGLLVTAAFYITYLIFVHIHHVTK